MKKRKPLPIVIRAISRKILKSSPCCKRKNRAILLMEIRPAFMNNAPKAMPLPKKRFLAYAYRQERDQKSYKHPVSVYKAPSTMPQKPLLHRHK